MRTTRRAPAQGAAAEAGGGITLPPPGVIFEANNPQWAQATNRRVSFDTIYSNDNDNLDLGQVMPPELGLSYDFAAAEGNGNYYTDVSSRNSRIEVEVAGVFACIFNYTFAADDSAILVPEIGTYYSGAQAVVDASTAAPIHIGSVSATLYRDEGDSISAKMVALLEPTANPYDGLTYASLEIIRLA